MSIITFLFITVLHINESKQTIYLPVTRAGSGTMNEGINTSIKEHIPKQIKFRVLFFFLSNNTLYTIKK